MYSSSLRENRINHRIVCKFSREGIISVRNFIVLILFVSCLENCVVKTETFVEPIYFLNFGWDEFCSCICPPLLNTTEKLNKMQRTKHCAFYYLCKFNFFFFFLLFDIK